MRRNTHLGRHLAGLSPLQVTRSFPGPATGIVIARDPVPIQKIETPELRQPESAPDFANQPALPVRDELRYALFQTIPLSIGTQAQLVLPKPAIGTRRVYLIVICTDAVNRLIINFDQDPIATPVVGLPINANFGSMEFNATIPQNNIHIIGSAAATTGVLVYANDTVAGVTT